MTLINVRDLAFPQGDNSSDTLVGGIHWNLTTLNHWNYTYYSNGTFSNGSRCFVIFEPYTPQLLSNGTFVNSTSCYSPIDPMEVRSKVGIFFACFFALSIMFTSINLRKHGRLFLPSQKRFRAIGRRWQWYWMLAAATCALISNITNVDVDRYFLPELPVVLSTFFWYLMLPCIMAVVWESVRHWGSWQERQLIDPNPFMLHEDDRRAKLEFWLPLVFYFFFWMNFFMVVPRPWSAIEKQRYPSQTLLVAQPAATDWRFKAAAFFLFAAWLTIIFSLRHSIKHYKPRNRGQLNRVFGLISYTPTEFLLTLPLSLVMIGYAAACSFDFSISPLNLHPDLGMMYGLGWGVPSAIIVVHEVWGYLDPNEDRELIRQRRVRGEEIDQELGITKKPRWWSRLQAIRDMSVHETIKHNVAQLGGGNPTTRGLETGIEMGNMPVSRKLQERDEASKGPDEDAIRMAAGFLFPNQRIPPKNNYWDPNAGHPMKDRSPDGRQRNIQRSDSVGSGNSGISLTAKPQVVRSMLDV